MKTVISTNIREAVSTCFAEDNALIESFHVVAGLGLDECIERTVSDLSNADSSFKFYLILNDEKLIGYFGKEFHNYLTTIFVRPSYRNKQSISQIWNVIKSHFPEEFYTAIYSKNTPAIRFFSRNGEVVQTFKTQGEDATQFKFKR